MNDAATKGAVLIIAGIRCFLAPFMASSCNVAIPAMGNEFLMEGHH
jgi:hypothetical protein